MSDNILQPVAEFQALPLEFIVATPLVAAVKAQSMSAEATKGFILSLIDKKTNFPVMVEFKAELEISQPATAGAGGATGAAAGANAAGNAAAGATATKNLKTMQIKAPLLSMVPIPHLRIDSLTTHFKYEITQTVKTAKAQDLSGEMEARTGAVLSPWVSASLKGSVSSKSSEESTMNRSGVLEITVHASEAPIPDGLSKILGLLSNSIQCTPVP